MFRKITPAFVYSENQMKLVNILYWRNEILNLKAGNDEGYYSLGSVRS
jgi:hypothetical protein